MKTIDEINMMVKKAYSPLPGLKGAPIDYFKQYPEYDKNMQQNYDKWLAAGSPEGAPSSSAKPYSVAQKTPPATSNSRLTQNRQAIVMPKGTGISGSGYTGHQVSQGGSAPVDRVQQSEINTFKAWQNRSDPRFANPNMMANMPSMQMQRNMNRQLTAEDAFKEIMRRKPGMDPAQARRLAPMVASKYRVNAKGEWVARGASPTRVNSAIARNFRAGPSPAVASKSQTPPVKKQANWLTDALIVNPLTWLYEKQNESHKAEMAEKAKQIAKGAIKEQKPSKPVAPRVNPETSLAQGYSNTYRKNTLARPKVWSGGKQISH